jgi:hypothetical protein
MRDTHGPRLPVVPIFVPVFPTHRRGDGLCSATERGGKPAWYSSRTSFQADLGAFGAQSPEPPSDTAPPEPTRPFSENVITSARSPPPRRISRPSEHSFSPCRRPARMSEHWPIVLPMNRELLGRLQPFREEALKRGIPPEDVERWIATARPSGTLVTSGDGPVVGRFGGPLMLPPEAPDPWTPLLATLDCAALPEEVTGLPLPPDGRLLLFGFPDMEMTWYGGSVGEVVYMPAGTPVEERKTRYAYVYGEEGDDVDDSRLRIYEQFPQEELRLSADIALPYHFTVDFPEPPDDDALPGHPRSCDLAEVWEETSHGIAVDGPLHIGGYAFHECTETDAVVGAAQDAEQRRRFRLTQGSNEPGDAVELPAPEHWVLLAQWDIGLSGREGSTLHWVIPRQDLAERRFDRAHVSFFWNP